MAVLGATMAIGKNTLGKLGVLVSPKDERVGACRTPGRGLEDWCKDVLKMTICVVWRTFGDNSINNRIISKYLRNTQQLAKHCCWLIAHVFFWTWTWSDMKRAIVAGSPDLQWFVERFCRLGKRLPTWRKDHSILSRSLLGVAWTELFHIVCFLNLPRDEHYIQLTWSYVTLQDSYKTTQTHGPYLAHTAIRSLDAQAWKFFFAGGLWED